MLGDTACDRSRFRTMSAGFIVHPVPEMNCSFSVQNSETFSVLLFDARKFPALSPMLSPLVIHMLSTSWMLGLQMADVRGFSFPFRVPLEVVGANIFGSDAIGHASDAD